MLEVRLVVRAGGQQHDPRVLLVAGRERPQGVAQRLEEWGEPLHPAVAERLGECARDDDAVLEGVAGPRRGLRAVAEHEPAAVGAAPEVGRVEVQVPAAGDADAVDRPQESGVRVDQLRRDQALLEEPLRAVQVVEDQFQEPRALPEARLQGGGLGLRDQQRDRVELPRPRGAVRVAVDVVGDAVLADELLRLVPAADQLRRAEFAQRVEQRLPVRPGRAVAADRLAVSGRRGGGGIQGVE